MRSVCIPFLVAISEVASLRVQHHIALNAPERDVLAILQKKRNELKKDQIEDFETTLAEIAQDRKVIDDLLEAGESIRPMVEILKKLEAKFTKKYSLPSDLFSADLPAADAKPGVVRASSDELSRIQPSNNTWKYVVASIVVLILLIAVGVIVFYQRNAVVKMSPQAAAAPSVSPSVLLQRQASLGQQVADPAIHVVK